MWKKYAENIKRKFETLSLLVEKNNYHLSTSKDEKKYIANFPADYGGLGEILDDQKYEHLNFFEYKPNKNKTIPSIEIKQGSICVPLESKTENLNNNINTPSYVTNLANLNNNIYPGNAFPTPHNFPHPFYPPHLMYRPPPPIEFTTMMEAHMNNVTNITQYAPYININSINNRDSDETESNSSRRERKRRHEKSKSKDIINLTKFIILIN